MDELPSSESCPRFHGLDPARVVAVYRRSLPHWRQDGATYFVTFRLHDSLPREVIAAWQEEDRLWLLARGIMGALNEDHYRREFEALPDVERQRFERHRRHRLHLALDECFGSCLLKTDGSRGVVADALLHVHGARCWTGDFVVMPNHVHALLQPMAGHDLEQVLNSVKGFTSTRLTSLGAKTGRLWQSESYDRIVRDREELCVWRRYIAENPAKATLARGTYTLHRAGWLDA